MNCNTNPNDVILNYHNICIRSRDISLLTGPGDLWINDVLLGFFFTYLEHNPTSYLPSYLTNSPHCDKIAFIDPCTAKALEILPDISPLVEHLDFNSKILLLFPINSGNGSGNGEHWSLAAIYRRPNSDKSFQVYHYDSASNSGGLSTNSYNVKSLALNLSPVLYLNSDNHKNNFDVINVKGCPFQANGNDCGIYCYTFAKRIAQNFVRHFNEKSENIVLNDIDEGVFVPGSKMDLELPITPQFIKGERKRLFDLVLELARV
ncbi:unnamed protein product [Gordionus sp. m RMFG-2023]|uniref:sentrin-specific protease 8-like isoform X1 n=1 Tax=Gordionus sp. m RMFG-2023 TaxID=3053472 RepID=UPI0030DFDE32